jgi:hypothetical protein
MDREQQEQFRKAVDRKAAAAEAASHNPRREPRDPDVNPAAESELTDAAQDPDTLSVRAKSSRHGHVTADHWNQ